jgi:MFS family permease
MKRNVFLLAICQALLVTATSMMIITSALVGQQLASPALATIPLGLQFLGMMASTFPASLLMKRIGRRLGFIIGAVIGISGAGLSTYAIFAGSFMLFNIGSLLLGIFTGFGQVYRFAAADVATADYRSRAISLVLAGGVVAAFIGPNLARLTRDSMPVTFAGSYAAIIVIHLLALSMIATLHIARPSAEERREQGRPLLEVALQPVYIVAVLSGMIGYGVMNLVMTATPLAMDFYQHPFSDTAFVIQWHILGMFVPSFYTGHLIKRFGVFNIMTVGAIVLIGCVLVNFAGTGVWHFWLALLLLGIGWNFLFIGATNLITETYRPAEKAKAQALNDFLVFGTVTATAFTAGTLQHLFGWRTVNAGVIPLIVLVLLTTLWLRRQHSSGLNGDCR